MHHSKKRVILHICCSKFLEDIPNQNEISSRSFASLLPERLFRLFVVSFSLRKMWLNTSPGCGALKIWCMRYDAQYWLSRSPSMATCEQSYECTKQSEHHLYFCSKLKMFNESMFFPTDLARVASPSPLPIWAIENSAPRFMKCGCRPPHSDITSATKNWYWIHDLFVLFVQPCWDWLNEKHKQIMDSSLLAQITVYESLNAYRVRTWFRELIFALHKGSDDFSTVHKFRNRRKAAEEKRVRNFLSSMWTRE